MSDVTRIELVTDYGQPYALELLEGSLFLEMDGITVAANPPPPGGVDFEGIIKDLIEQKVQPPSIPRDVVKELESRYATLLKAVQEYWDYDHNGDPYTEDARAMGEMELDDIEAERKEFEAALTNSEGD